VNSVTAGINTLRTGVRLWDKLKYHSDQNVSAKKMTEMSQQLKTQTWSKSYIWIHRTCRLFAV